MSNYYLNIRYLGFWFLEINWLNLTLDQLGQFIVEVLN